MKKFLIIILFLSLISCIPFKNNHEIDAPASTVAIELSATIPTLLGMTAIQYPDFTTTFRLSATPTTLPKVIATLPFSKIYQQGYNPSRWKILYDKNMVWKIGLGFKEQIWILTFNQVGYFNGKNWFMFSEKDIGLSDIYDMSVAPNGTVWLASRQGKISHYQDGRWHVYSIPNADKNCYPGLAIDSSNKVWLALWDWNYGCGNSIRTFDGSNWNEISLTSIGQVEARQLLFSPDRTLWAIFDELIGNYDGKTWKLYPNLWVLPQSESSYFGINIASDNQGNIYGVAAEQEWFVKISRDGNVSKIPFDFVNYKFDMYRYLRLFIDNKGGMWTNACRNEQNRLVYHNCFVYYQDNHWVSFKNLPFESMIDMKELSDGTLLIATNNGLYQYNPEN